MLKHGLVSSKRGKCRIGSASRNLDFAEGKLKVGTGAHPTELAQHNTWEEGTAAEQVKSIPLSRSMWTKVEAINENYEFNYGISYSTRQTQPYGTRAAQAAAGSVPGEAEGAAIPQPWKGQGDGRDLLLPKNTSWEAIEKSEPDFSQRCTRAGI